MKITIVAITLVLCVISNASAQPKVFILNAAYLQQLQRKMREKDPLTVRLVLQLQKQADELMQMKPVSVMDKEFTAVSCDKHDYMSQAPYFWYDSTKPNGLPYMRRDGERNPEINKITDHKYLSDLDHATKVLSLTYYLTGNEKYADKAAALIRHWFIDKDFKMNPNLDYAQAIPGKNTGRGIGLIETRSLTGIADAAGLLANSRPWSNADAKALQQWYADFLHWMLTSKNGNDEHKAKNNHGSWYLVQATDFALFTGDKAEAKKLATEGRHKIDSQITEDGSMPLELARTKALGYSTFNLSALFTLASLAEQSGVDLWHYTNPKGAGLQTALDWLTPYALGEKKWEYKQIEPYNVNEIYPLLMKAAKKYKEPRYLSKAIRIDAEAPNVLDELLFKD